MAFENLQKSLTFSELFLPSVTCLSVVLSEWLSIHHALLPQTYQIESEKHPLLLFQILPSLLFLKNIRSFEYATGSAWDFLFCIIATLSNTQHPYFHHWKPGKQPHPASLPQSLHFDLSVAVAKLDSSPYPSFVATSSASSSASGIAPGSAAKSTHTSSDADPSPNSKRHRIKAGITGFPEIQLLKKAALEQVALHISWYSDYEDTCFTGGGKSVEGVGMVSSHVSSRYSSAARCCLVEFKYEGLTTLQVLSNDDLKENDPAAPNGGAAQGDKDRYTIWEHL